MSTFQARLREALDAHRSMRESLGSTYRRLEALLEEATDPAQRGLINALIWECAALSEARAPYFSQCGQDAFLDAHVFKGKRDGVFVEVGAYDGVTGSNTLFLELMRGWTGLLIEPVAAQFDKARAFRGCRCSDALIGPLAEQAGFLQIDAGPLQMSGLTASYDADRRAWVDAQTESECRLEQRATRPLAEVLAEHGLDAIDYISLDIEGAERAVLETFPFDRHAVTCWGIEAARDREAIEALMTAQGYQRMETLGEDDIYVCADTL
jgi:hypothetical protein